VFMDAYMPVTHEEGDRYPLGPPRLGILTANTFRLINEWLVVRFHHYAYA
jgi:hypothetical protein